MGSKHQTRDFNLNTSCSLVGPGVAREKKYYYDIFSNFLSLLHASVTPECLQTSSAQLIQ